MSEAAISCTQCGTANPQQAQFCMSCGSALAISCPACGAPAPPSARFCMSCGGALAGAAGAQAAPGAASPPGVPAAPGAQAGTGAAAPPGAPRPAPPASPAAPEPVEHEEERRTVTVLFADLSGYTAIAERLDPEAVKALVDRFLGRLGEEVERVGGRVDKYIGDDVMAIFGAPVAHEDDPERAVRAAVGDAGRDGRAQPARWPADYGVEFALCVGINTGEVLAGQGRRGLHGDRRRRQRRLAAAGSAQPAARSRVGERTQRATAGVVEYSALEPLELKGKAEPVAAWRGGRLSSSEQRSGAACRARAAPLVGRHDEFARAADAATSASRANGASASRRPCSARPAWARPGCCASSSARSSTRDPPRARAQGTLPLVRLGRRLLAAQRNAARRMRDRRRRPRRRSPGRSFERRLGSLLAGGDEDEGSRSAASRRSRGCSASRRRAMARRRSGEDAQSARESFFGAVRAYLEALAQGEPLVLAWEDIHWADEGMLDLIEYLSQWLRAPVLQVCLARDELLERRPGVGRLAAHDARACSSIRSRPPTRAS